MKFREQRGLVYLLTCRSLIARALLYFGSVHNVLCLMVVLHGDKRNYDSSEAITILSIYLYILHDPC